MEEAWELKQKASAVSPGFYFIYFLWDMLPNLRIVCQKKNLAHTLTHSPADRALFSQ